MSASTGTSTAAFLSIPVGAGPAAMGSAYSALATDGYATAWNPAGLAFVQGMQVAAQHLSYLESVNEEFLGVAVPLRPGDALGVSAQYLGSGDIAGLDANGNSIGNYTDTFGAYGLSYGHAFSERWSLGLTGKWIHVKLQDVGASGYATDAGTLFKVSDALQVAAVLTNAGGKLNFLGDGDALPTTLHLGAGYRVNRRWRFSSDILFPKGDPIGWHGGIEWRPVDAFAWRAGYRTDTTTALSALAGFSTGVGIEVWGQEFAYAWVPYGDLGDTQYFSLVLHFGKTASQDQRLSHAR